MPFREASKLSPSAVLAVKVILAVYLVLALAVAAGPVTGVLVAPVTSNHSTLVME